MRKYFSVYERFALHKNAIHTICFGTIVVTLKYFPDMDLENIVRIICKYKRQLYPLYP